RTKHVRYCIFAESLHVLLLFFFSSRRRHTRSKRDWSSDVCSSDLVCFVGELDGQIIGVFVLSQQEPNIVEIMNIAVDEDYQGKGIGKQLIHHAIKSAKEEAYQTI